MSLPGDGLIAMALLQATHAITIDTAPERIWPWLLQIGQGRAGFYSDSPWWDSCVDLYYHLLSYEQGRRRVRYQKRDRHIASEWQNLRVGDAIPDGPPGTAYYLVRQIEPNRSLVLSTDTHLPFLLPALFRKRVAAELSVAYLLIPVTEGQTRLVRRMRMNCRPRWFQPFVAAVVWVWGERLTARNFLRGLKRRAESGSYSDADRETASTARGRWQ
jgi:hypothetical protein